MAHRVTGAASLFFCTQSQSSGTWRSMSAWSPACSMSLRNVHWTARCGLVLAPPYLQQNGLHGCVARDCSHMSSEHTWSAGLHPTPHKAVTP